MPSTVIELLEAAQIRLSGKVMWGEIPRSNDPGIYIVSLSPHDDENQNISDFAPISLERIRFWLDRVPTIELDGVTQPAPQLIQERLAKFWMPDESILYIGMTERKLGKRIDQYYKTELGDKRPHAGGHWIKTLVNLDKTYVYYAKCPDPSAKKDILLEIFINGVSKTTIASLRDPERPFPFGNLEFPKGNRKRHGLSKTKLR